MSEHEMNTIEPLEPRCHRLWLNYFTKPTGPFPNGLGKNSPCWYATRQGQQANHPRPEMVDRVARHAGQNHTRSHWDMTPTVSQSHWSSSKQNNETVANLASKWDARRSA